jgi:hypothetical protein
VRDVSAVVNRGLCCCPPVLPDICSSSVLTHSNAHKETPPTSTHTTTKDRHTHSPSTVARMPLMIGGTICCRGLGTIFGGSAAAKPARSCSWVAAAAHLTGQYRTVQEKKQQKEQGWSG